MGVEQCKYLLGGQFFQYYDSLTYFQSGSPAINAEILAPFESGAQLIRIPQTEFIQRCLKTPGVTDQQAKAFYNKVWRQHIDNTQKKILKPATVNTIDQESINNLSSLPFKVRIKPGMVIQYKSKYEEVKIPMALILCPDWAVETHVVDVRGEEVKGIRNEGPKRYLCAAITPAMMDGAFELNVWRQVVVDVKDMEKELLMEYDAATRFYHLTV
jgi:kinesin family protein 2/24